MERYNKVEKVGESVNNKNSKKKNKLEFIKYSSNSMPKLRNTI